MEVIYPNNSITAKQKNELEPFLMPFLIMSRIVFVRQRALIIASKAANGPPAMQLLKNKQINNQSMGSGEV